MTSPRAPQMERESFQDRSRRLLRALGALGGFYAIAGLVAVVLMFVLPDPRELELVLSIAVAAVPVIVGALLAMLLWARKGWRPWSEMGWPGVPKPARAFAIGLAIGIAMAGAALLLEVVAGTRITLTGEAFGGYVRAAAGLAAALLVAALSEELMFRGFPLSRLTDAIGPAGASLLLAFGFSAMHAINPGISPLAILNIAVASLFLSAVYFRLGGLPAAWGAHVGWNAALGAMVDAPVSGIAFQVPLVEYSAPGVQWITGGEFGPEGGIIGTAVMAAVTIWLGRGTLIEPRESA